MPANAISRLARFGISALVVLGIALCIHVKNILGLAAVLLLLLGIGLLFFKRWRPLLNSQEKILIAVFAAHFAAQLLALWVAGFDEEATSKLERTWLLVSVIPVYFAINAIKLSALVLWGSAIGGAVLASVLASYEVFFLEEYRADGSTNAIIYGNICVVFACISLASLPWFNLHLRNWRWLPFIGLGCGIFAAVLSASRGSWVALLVVLLCFAFIHRHYFKRRQLLVGGVFAIIAILLAWNHLQILSDRMSSAFVSLSHYSDAPIDDPVRGESANRRLEMWQASWKIFVDSPFLGAGLGNFRQLAQEQVEQGLRHPYTALHENPHNQFISTLVSGGLIGLGTLCAVMLLPLLIFYRTLSHPDTELASLSVGGTVFVLAFATGMLTDSLLERSLAATFFLVVLALTLALHRIRLRTIES
ncbi:MAG: O-antigen ligase family protein [Pseudomonadota bacterium]